MSVLTRIVLIGFVMFIAGCKDQPAATPQEPAPQVAQAVSAEAEPACELVMGWDPWEPYQYEIAGGQVFGLDVDLVTAVVRNADCDIDFRKGSWRELLQQLEAGEIDLLAGATRTADREAFARFTRPYRDEAFLLYVPAARMEELAGLDLEQVMDQGLRIGVIEDYLYGDPVAAFQDDSEHAGQFVYSALAETNIARLIDGAVDGIIEDQYVGAAIIRHKDLGGVVTTHPLRFDSTAVSFMVSRASVDEDTFKRLDASVGELLQSGAIGKVLSQYGNP